MIYIPTIDRASVTLQNAFPRPAELVWQFGVLVVTITPILGGTWIFVDANRHGRHALLRTFATLLSGPFSLTVLGLYWMSTRGVAALRFTGTIGEESVGRRSGQRHGTGPVDTPDRLTVDDDTDTGRVGGKPAGDRRRGATVVGVLGYTGRHDYPVLAVTVVADDHCRVCTCDGDVARDEESVVGRGRRQYADWGRIAETDGTIECDVAADSRLVGTGHADADRHRTGGQNEHEDCQGGERRAERVGHDLSFIHLS